MMSFLSDRSRLLFLIAFLQAAIVVYAVHFTDFHGSVPQFRRTAAGGMLLDTKPEFSTDGVYRRLESYGEEGRAVYSFRLFTVDLLLPVSIVFFLVTAVHLSVKNLRRPRLRFFFLLLPWVFFLFDLAENSTLYVILGSYPDRREILASVLPWFSTLKRVGMIGSLLTALSFAAISVRRRAPGSGG